MKIARMSNEEARINFHNLIENAIKRIDTIIERYNRPMAVVIPYDDYIAIKDVLEEYRQNHS